MAVQQPHTIRVLNVSMFWFFFFVAPSLNSIKNEDKEFRWPTSNVQLALHLISAQLVDGHAGVFAAVKGARPANVEGHHALVVLHQVLGVVADDHLVLHPHDLGLRSQTMVPKVSEQTLPLFYERSPSRLGASLCE